MSCHEKLEILKISTENFRVLEVGGSATLVFDGFGGSSLAFCEQFLSEG